VANLFYRNRQKISEKTYKSAQERILKYLNNRISNSENPKLFGKPLSANLKGFWRFRVDDYRIICEIFDDKLVVSVLEIDHRSKIYN
jgi:mRNA interferase RelE/StbE